jgi:hypothetical protein
MNIYQLETSGEVEWICANTAIQALKYYEDITDMSLVEFDNTDDITIVPESEWATREIFDFDNPNEDGTYPVLCTFAEFMKGQTTPEIIATTCI